MTLAVAAEHHVVNNVHIAHKSHAQTVLGNKRKTNAKLSYLQRSFVAQIVGFACFGIVVCNAAALDMLQSRNCLQQLALTAARDAGNAQYLAAARGE